MLSGFIYRLITDSVSDDDDGGGVDDVASTIILKSKVGALIQQLVSQRDVTSLLIKHKVSGPDDSMWTGKMRTYYRSDDTMLDHMNIFKKLVLKCNGNTYFYGTICKCFCVQTLLGFIFCDACPVGLGVKSAARTSPSL